MRALATARTRASTMAWLKAPDLSCEVCWGIATSAARSSSTGAAPAQRRRIRVGSHEVVLVRRFGSVSAECPGSRRSVVATTSVSPRIHLRPSAVDYVAAVRMLAMLWRIVGS